MGPVQLLIFAFDRPDFDGSVIAELDRLKESGLVRLIDGAVIYKDDEGDVAIYERSDLTIEEAEELGAVVGALIGLGLAGEEGAELGAELGAEAAEEGFGLLDAEDLEDIIEDLPEDSAVAAILLEHRWAMPLREAVFNVGGVPVVDEWVHPLDLVAVGLMEAEEAEVAARTRGRPRGRGRLRPRAQRRPTDLP